MTTLRRHRNLVVLVAFSVFTLYLALSDFAGDMFGVLINVVRNAGRSFEARTQLDLLDRSDIPGQADQIGHALFFGAATILVGWIARKRVPVPLTALGVFAISLMLEVAQPLLSDGRAGQISDAVGNAVGVTAGALALLAFLGVYRRWRGDDRQYFGDTVHLADEPTDEYMLPG